MTKQYERPEWINGFYGYALATDQHCKIQKSDRARPARSIDTSNGFFLIRFDYSGQLYCPPDIHLPLEARRFEYSYYYKQENPWDFTEMHQKFVPNKWTVISKVEMLIIQNKNLFNFSNFTSSSSFGWLSFILDIKFGIVIMIIVIYVIFKRKCCKNLTTFQTNHQRRNVIRRESIAQFNKPECSSKATCQIAMNKYEPTVTFSAPHQGLDL